MNLLNLLLFSEVIVAHTVLYQPQDIVYAAVNTTTVINCVSDKILEGGTWLNWYRKSGRTGAATSWVKLCLYDNNTDKYACKYDKYKAKLEIYNTQTNDSGVYFCTYFASSREYGNGTTVIAGANPLCACSEKRDKKQNPLHSSTSRSSVYILAPAQPPLLNTFVQLACVVRAVRHTVHVTWNISGTYHKGRMTSMEEPDGTWTFLNLISLPRSTWGHGEHVTCEIWFNSSPVRVHWEISERGEPLYGFTSRCQKYLILVPTSVCLLLLVLSIHLTWTYKQTDNKIQGSEHKDSVNEDGIVYSQLDMNYLSRTGK